LTKQISPDCIIVTHSVGVETHVARKSQRYREEGFEMV